MAKDKKDRFTNNINVKNRKASFEFEFIEKYVAGIVLSGTEIKSIKEGQVVLSEAFCAFTKGELWVREMHISQYLQGTHYNHEMKAPRKLLLSKRELKKLEGKAEDKGLTIIPTRLFINERGWAKLEIALARGKKIHDKRDSIKEKDLKRELDRMKI